MEIPAQSFYITFQIVTNNMFSSLHIEILVTIICLFEYRVPKSSVSIYQQLNISPAINSSSQSWLSCKQRSARKNANNPQGWTNYIKGALTRCCTFPRVVKCWINWLFNQSDIKKVCARRLRRRW